MKIQINRVNIQVEGKNTVGFAYLQSDGTYLVKTIYGIYSRTKAQIFAFFEPYFLTLKFYNV